MKKQNLKPLILSALGAMAMAGVGTGATFALFTDKAETQINVQAGVIDVGTSASIFKVFEYNGTEAGLEVAPTAEDDYTNSIGGTTKKLQDGTFGLGNWAPGDRVQIKVNASNASTVKAKVRLKAVLSGVLADALVVKIGNDSFTTVELAAQGDRTLVTDWTELAPGSNPANFGIEVSFPNVGTEITSRDEGENNLYQGKSASLLVTYEAVQGNASVTSSLLERINNKLASEQIVDGEANATMFDALADLSDEEVEAVYNNGYVWSVENDEFRSFNVIPTDSYKYFKMYGDAASVDNTYSVYAYASTWAENVSLNGLGFDAGDATGIATVNYVGAADARTNIIRTNSASTTLTIDDASTGTIYHYGSAGTLNIIQCHTASYHENGNVAYAEIAKGRIVLEKGADVEEIHINKKENEQAFDTVIIANNGGSQELPERITRDAVTVTEQKLVVTVESNGSSEQVFVYANGASGTTEKVTEGESKQNETVNSALGQLVLDNGSAGEKAQTSEQKAAAKDEVAAEAVTAASNVDFGDSVARIGNTGYPTLQAAIDAAENGNVVVLLKDIDVETGVTMGGSATFAATITKSLVINGCGFRITTKTDRVLGIKGNSAPIDVTIKNVSLIASNKDAAQCIYTNDNLNSLTLDNVIADNTAANSGYIQAITVSYKDDTTSLRHIKIKNSKILNQSNKGYSIILWVPVEMEISNSEIQGWSPLYFKPTSSGSSVSIEGGKLSCVGVDGASNSFGLINFESGAVGIPAQIHNTEINVKTEATNSYQSIVSFSEWYGPNNGSVVTIDGGSITLTGEHAVFVKDNGTDNSLIVTNCSINNNGVSSTSYSYVSPELSNQVAYMYTQVLNNVPTTVCDGYNDLNYYLAHSSQWFCDGEWFEFYSPNVTLSANANFGMNSSHIGEFGLLLGNSTLNPNGYKITILEGVTVKTDKQLTNVFAAPAGFNLVETEIEDGAYHYSYSIVAA